MSYKQILTQLNNIQNPDDIDPEADFGLSEIEATQQLLELKEQLIELQHKLYASRHYSYLLIFQGMDTCGKDGVIRTVFAGVDPLGLQVQNFKKPTETELAHDFLWRAHLRTPEKGIIGLFNRSYYEGVISDPVQGIIDHATVLKRYNQINQFEQMLFESGTQIIKFYLKISKAEQKRRLIRRMELPEKRWKLSAADASERKRWDNYMNAYRDTVQATHQDYAPWYTLPADKKWVRSYLVASAVVGHLKSLDLKYPQPALPFQLNDLDD